MSKCEGLQNCYKYILCFIIYGFVVLISSLVAASVYLKHNNKNVSIVDISALKMKFVTVFVHYSIQG